MVSVQRDCALFVCEREKKRELGGYITGPLSLILCRVDEEDAGIERSASAMNDSLVDDEPPTVVCGEVRTSSVVHDI